MLAEAGEVAGPGAAGIDRGRDAAVAAERVGIDAERGPAPIDMGVEVDQAGRDDEAREIADVGAGVVEPIADLRNLAAREGDIRHPVEILRRVDHAPALEDEVVGHFAPAFCVTLPNHG